jgi:F-type H+-transporting ATPase subunit epsilon
MATAANTIHVDIVSAEGEIFSGAASMVFAPGTDGELGIAPRHAPLLTLLKAGEVRVQTSDGAEQHFFVGGGALEIQPAKVTVLADTALRAKDLDEAAALAAKQRAEDALRNTTDKLENAEAIATEAQFVPLSEEQIAEQQEKLEDATS